ncbi:SRPBCC family protein [Nocardia neocaledoniensis]|uniref:SRPBCC family protein n=1 Tax=Nocardia neocaledoniensis TaxID=236511 RepID=UPI002455E25B|nr:SRPBCC family protein [Nocardia neocaledoniensis]
MPFALRESDDAFLATAANRCVHVVDLAAPPSAVWAALTADDALVSWSAAVTGMRWTSRPPYGVGSTRVVTLGGVAALTERFYRWDDERRMTFTVDAATVPGLRRFAEDLQLTPTGTGTTLTWTFAVEGGRALRPLLRLSGPVTDRLTGSIARGIARVVETAP